MCDEDGLRVLHVRAARHHSVAGAHGLPDKSLSDIKNAPSQVTRLLAQVHTDERGDLIVTGAAGAKLATQRCSGSLDEATLKRGVDVFIVSGGHKRTGGDICVKACQRVMHVGALLVGQQSNAMQLVSMRMRARDVHVRQAEVEVRRHAQCRQRLRRPSRKTTTPERDVRFGLRHENPPGSGTTMIYVCFKNIRDVGGPPTATPREPRPGPSPTSRS